MSQVRESQSNGALKRLKVFVYAAEKGSDMLTTSLKAAVLIFLLTSIAIALYSAFGVVQTHQTRLLLRCSGCHVTQNDASETTQTTFPGEKPDQPSTPTNISHIVFGIGGSITTWKDRRQYSELWWQPNSTRGYVWLEEQPDPSAPWPETSPPYRVSTQAILAVRISRIVVDTFRLGLPDVRWFVMGDDDTVFFADNLVSVLSRYDHRHMYYVGGNSESVEQDVLHSYGMAFGGGGFAVSYPLAERLVKVFDGCLARYHNLYGSDERVWACVSEIGVSLTNERGFHQIDVRDDLYGILAAHPLTPLVSLHHLDYVKPLFPNQSQFESLRALMQAYRVDPAQTMQQCFCHYRDWRHKWSVSISWGYTVQIYSSLLTANVLETPLQTFRTWRSWSDGPFTFNTRLVSPDPCEQPAIYYLDWVREAGDGETLTSYQRYVVEPKKKCPEGDHRLVVEKIVVSAEKMDPQQWNKGPHRKCCEISSLKYGRMKVKIRSCKTLETVTS